MFGFLKQKLADFGNKLKKTAEEKEKEAGKKEELTENNKQEHKKETKAKTLEEKKEKQIIEQKPKYEEKSKLEEKQKIIEKEAKKEIPAETKTAPLEKETKPANKEKAETKKEEEKPKAKKGLFGILFGGRKNKEAKEKEEKKHLEKKETKIKEKEAPLEKKKKTKEEIAAEMEAKMFAEIEGELKKEGKENLKELEEESEAIEEEKILEKEEPIAIKIEETIKKEETLLEEKEAEEKTPEKEEIKLGEEELSQEVEEEEEEIEEKVEQETRAEKSRDIHINTLEEDKRELKAKVGVGGKLKGFLFGGVEITEGQIDDLLWELELSLIESDVEQDAAKELVKQIKERLVGQKVSPKNLDDYLKEQIKEILAEMMNTEKIDLLEEAKKAKSGGRPLKILMLGPNGAGKTTSIAKLVHYFQKHKMTCIVAAADTFRAGAIDQLEEHAKKLNVRVIKQQYGADPAAVSFDAVKAAEAGGINVVIIDSAGRQETNKNLMEELRKIERVAKPDLKIYVGEAYVGQALLEQVAEFEEIIGIDGFILTKIDTDAKGGTAISLLYKMKKPIIFVGTGQGYEDFKEFTPEFVLERII